MRVKHAVLTLLFSAGFVPDSIIGGLPAQAADGDLSTGWHAGAALPETLSITFTAPLTIIAVALTVTGDGFHDPNNSVLLAEVGTPLPPALAGTNITVYYQVCL